MEFVTELYYWTVDYISTAWDSVAAWPNEHPLPAIFFMIYMATTLIYSRIRESEARFARQCADLKKVIEAVSAHHIRKHHQYEEY